MHRISNAKREDEDIVETGTQFMVVRVRFGRGPAISRRPGKNSRIALLAASLLTLVSISLASLGMWRIGVDLDWAGNFVFSGGLLSHWQVWIGAAVAVQYLGLRLARYARKALAPDPGDDGPSAENGPGQSSTRTRVTANV
jgi:hypothetical protein